MKIKLFNFLFLLTILFSFSLSGQSDSTKKRIVEHQGMYNINFMRTDLKDWTQGGESNTNGSLMIREQLKIQSKKATGRHLMQLNYGLNNQAGRTTKTIDNWARWWWTLDVQRQRRLMLPRRLRCHGRHLSARLRSLWTQTRTASVFTTRLS